MQGQHAGQATANNMVNVKYGVYSQPTPFGGQSVRQIRDQLRGSWDIPSDAVAYKGKEALSDDYIAQPGDQIDFHRRMGEKG